MAKIVESNEQNRLDEPSCKVIQPCLIIRSASSVLWVYSVNGKKYFRQLETSTPVEKE
jgi:hypothetical protein